VDVPHLMFAVVIVPSESVIVAETVTSSSSVGEVGSIDIPEISGAIFDDEASPIIKISSISHHADVPPPVPDEV